CDLLESPSLVTARHGRCRRSVGIEHVLLEALDVVRQGEPWHGAGGEDVRAWSEPGGIVEGSSVENLHRREPLQRQANAVAARSAETEMQHAPVIRRAVAVGGE